MLFLFVFGLFGDNFGCERLDFDLDLDLDLDDFELDENFGDKEISCSAQLLQKPFLYGFFFVILAPQLQIRIYILSL